ncbi:hypothetical protein [Arthrobacter psychrochitiniphilus]|uniref:hypothetical protein n=1 Tax=Arthrobacter psychrochitiniphilus TaxID=291045 RepID=UPI003F7CCBEB
MSDRKIRRTARDANRQLDLGAHTDLDSIKKSLETTRDRPITIMELPTLRGDDLCGLCVAYSSHDVVVHAPPRSSLHQQQIIVHEFAHMILNHQVTATSLDLVQLPGFNETPLQVLGRNSFDDYDEAAAEYLADLLMARIRPDLEGPTDDQSGFNKVFG